MYEDFHMENTEVMNDWLYFEPPYEADYLCDAYDEEDNDDE